MTDSHASAADDDPTGTTPPTDADTDAETDTDALPHGATPADTLADAVAGLGETAEDQLETVAERNASLADRLPDDDLNAARDGSPDQG
ncbi:hypothetical protein [Leifsonia aquatica]|uniref:hypothetical protein n=1 Tax=Leifsonia aquatica TaxID=144185 RepID=UPI000468147E|nr:hypothetical protein [Leifsonia aquatica]